MPLHGTFVPDVTAWAFAPSIFTVWTFWLLDHLMPDLPDGGPSRGSRNAGGTRAVGRYPAGVS